MMAITRTLSKFQQNNSNYIVVLLTLFLLSCGQQENSYPVVKEEHYEDGKLKSEITYANDTTKTGAAKYYYKSGQIATLCFYKNNKLDSFYINYHANGNDKEKGYYYLGNTVGSIYFYYPTGRLETYNAKDFAQETFYVVKFDSVGNKIYEEGLVISPTVAAQPYKKQYLKGDSISLQYQVAQPPGYKSEVFVGMYKYEDDEKRSIVDNFNEIPLNAWSQAIYRNQFNGVGRYRVVCVGRLIDTARDYIKTDTTHQDFFIVAD